MLLSQSRLLIRADGGPKIGTGHIMRMMALSQAFRRRGGKVAMVVGELPRVLIRRLESEKIQLYQIRHHQGDAADAVDTREIAFAYQPNWIALDGYRFTDAYQSTIADSPAKLIVMDDFGHAAHQHADLVINQNIYSSATEPGPGCGPQRLFGIRYALLRDEFRNDSPRRIPAKSQASPGHFRWGRSRQLDDQDVAGIVRHEPERAGRRLRRGQLLRSVSGTGGVSSKCQVDASGPQERRSNVAVNETSGPRHFGGRFDVLRTRPVWRTNDRHCDRGKPGCTGPGNASTVRNGLH